MLLVGIWSIDSLIYPNTLPAIQSVISTLKWVIAAPVGIAIVAAAIWLIGVLIYEFLKEKPSVNQSPTVISPQPTVHRMTTKLNQVTEEENQKRKDEEKIKEHERREAEAAEKRARFHQVKQTRSAHEAAKASLEEF